MIYNINLNGKTYEVEVNRGVASVLSVKQAETLTIAPQQTAPVVAPVAVAPVVAPVATPVVAVAPVAAASSGATLVSSPLPGTLVDVKVTTGQSVKKGQCVAVIEAMKMENEISASRDGVIGKIFLTKGVQISIGAPILEIL
ncbi:MAG: biotin/lipoyl-containing protein [Clostridia bacterium]